MIQDNQLLDDFHSLPPDKQAEVVDFIDFLKSKQNKRTETKDESELRPFGVLNGKVWMSDDFNEPLEEFAEYM